MEAIKIDRKGVKMVAHRGLSGLELENTCAAFVAAGNRDYWGIETDIHVTADGKLVVIHDVTTGRVATENIPVEESTLETLRALQLQEVRNDNALRVDLRLPIPEEYFAICRRYRKVAVLELKNPMPQEAVNQVVALASQTIGLEQIVFISFSYQNLLYIRQAAPQAVCQYLTSNEASDALLEKLVQDGFSLDIYHKQVTPQLAEALHRAGLELNCWTVDDPDRAAELIEMGVDYITSNCLY